MHEKKKKKSIISTIILAWRIANLQPNKDQSIMV